MSHIFSKLKSDFKSFNKNNTDGEKVFSSHLFSSYKGTLVIKTPFRSSFSFGFIALSKRQQNLITLKHEYGHRVQLKRMGIFRYIKDVAVPSVATYRLSKKGKLLFDYYGAPWESEADELGEVNRTTRNKPWELPKNVTHRQMLKLMKKRKKQ